MGMPTTGYHAHHHRGIDHDVEEEIERDADGDEPAELAARGHGDPDAIADDDGEQQQQHHAADESEFLAERGNGEVGVLLGQEVEPALRSLHESLAAHAARPDRDLGLADIPAGAERIGLRD